MIIKNEKGITLIALVITIIIMLILVATSVTVVMQGGLFNRAREASIKTQYAGEREELLIHILGDPYKIIADTLALEELVNDEFFANSWEAVSPSFDNVDENTLSKTIKKKGTNTSGIVYTINRNYTVNGFIEDNHSTVFANLGINE